MLDPVHHEQQISWQKSCLVNHYPAHTSACSYLYWTCDDDKGFIIRWSMPASVLSLVREGLREGNQKIYTRRQVKAVPTRLIQRALYLFHSFSRAFLIRPLQIRWTTLWYVSSGRAERGSCSHSMKLLTTYELTHTLWRCLLPCRNLVVLNFTLFIKIGALL